MENKQFEMPEIEIVTSNPAPCSVETPTIGG